MEVVYTDTLTNQNFKPKQINGFFGDILDLLEMNLDIKGITYNDKWTLKRFLSSIIKHDKDRILSVMRYLNLDDCILNEKLENLTTLNFKYTLLAYLLINNKDIIILDHFEVGLKYKEQKELINILRNLKKDGKTIIIISNNPLFLHSIVDNIVIYESKNSIYCGNKNDLEIYKHIDDEPEILKFIKLANKKNANLTITLDSKELLKDIYRSVN